MAEWGFYLAPDAPKGMGKRLGETALDYAFMTLQFDKLNAEVIDYNHRSIAYHRRLGFIEEGRRDNYYRKESVFHSIVFFGLQRDHYQAQLIHNQKKGLHDVL